MIRSKSKFRAFSITKFWQRALPFQCDIARENEEEKKREEIAQKSYAKYRGCVCKGQGIQM